MEGGSVITNNNELADDLRSMRAHGWIRDRKDQVFLKNKYKNLDSRFLFVTSGYNFRPLEIQAAIGLVQLKKIDNFLIKRERHAKNITNILSTVEWLNVIGKEKIKKTFNKKERKHSWMNIPILLNKKAPINLEKVKKIFEDNNIEEIYNDTIKHLKKIVILTDAMAIIRQIVNVSTEPLCSICFQEVVSLVSIPCGHTFCISCGGKQLTNCYICRIPVKDRVKIYFS
jgi:dTDP-4-amino-4,6-dideoxygalactose transaminase